MDAYSKIKEWEESLAEKKVRRRVKQETLAKKQDGYAEELVYLENLQVARSLIQRASVITQEKLSHHIGELVTLAMQSVFDDPYSFEANFVNRRNTTECDLVFAKNGKQYKPLDSCGYGAADVSSFALRITFWALGNKRPTITWDEPFRQLDSKRIKYAAEIVKRLSEDLGIQLIIVTHEKELTACADKTFSVSMSDGVSKVITI